jgi:tRNA-specific 2-thiouridylase
MQDKTRRALALISGGLDSWLAAKVILQQGIEVQGLNFYTGFCVEGHTHAIRQHAKPKRNNALWVAEQLGIKLHIIDIIEEYKQVVLNPKHGYGQYLNPCLDCKIFMVKKAKEWADEHGFDFIITGEVIGQRPKSQRKATMPIVAAESGAEDRLLRPLCAKNLPITLPEREGWVKREALFDFSGRSRTPQLGLAKQYAISDFAQPAGGCCFLTNEHYSNKLADLWRAQGKREYEFDDIMLLKVGRHLRPKPHFKLIIGREEGENLFLEGYRKQFTHFKVLDHSSPLVLLDGEVSAEDIELAASIVGRYSQGRECESVQVQVTTQSGVSWVLNVTPLKSTEIPQDWYI